MSEGVVETSEEKVQRLLAELEKENHSVKKRKEKSLRTSEKELAASWVFRYWLRCCPRLLRWGTDWWRCMLLVNWVLFAVVVLTADSGALRLTSVLVFQLVSGCVLYGPHSLAEIRVRRGLIEERREHIVSQLLEEQV